MKTIIIGDIHGRDIWKQIITTENPDRVIFIGDYFDNFDISSVEQQHNFKQIIAFKETKVMEVIMLIGNHDYHYFPGFETYSGFQSGAAPVIKMLLEENKHHLQMCYQFDNILCSHAGIGYDWLVEQNKYESGSIPEFVNDLYKYNPYKFCFLGTNPYGDDKTQTPIWIRPRSLMYGNKNTFLKNEYIQIVGHTRVNNIDIEGKATGGRYYFIDALDNASPQYLVYEEGVFSLGTVNKKI
jgi:hypothetical protein